MALISSRVRTVAKRPEPSGINAVRLVHQNSTGQPWDKPGHGRFCEADLDRFGSGQISAAAHVRLR
jgi:hypothetical protein